MRSATRNVRPIFSPAPTKSGPYLSNGEPASNSPVLLDLMTYPITFISTERLLTKSQVCLTKHIIWEVRHIRYQSHSPQSNPRVLLHRKHVHREAASRQYSRSWCACGSGRRCWVGMSILAGRRRFRILGLGGSTAIFMLKHPIPRSGFRGGGRNERKRTEGWMGERLVPRTCAEGYSSAKSLRYVRKAEEG